MRAVLTLGLLALTFGLPAQADVDRVVTALRRAIGNVPRDQAITPAK